MTRPDFPAVIDSSLLATFRSCRYKAMLEYFLHHKPLNPSIHLHAGKAFAAGMERTRECFYIEGLDEDDAVAEGLKTLLVEYGDFVCPEDSAKSAARMAGAFEYYFSQYPLAEDKCLPAAMPGGKKGIEFSFAEPIDETHPVTGDPLLFCGRLDMLASYAGGLYGVDEKTTSQLGASWSKQWDLRSQFTAYCWGSGQAGYPLAGFIVRGISILKTKYETQQAITYRPKWMIDRWYEQMLRDVRDMKQCWESGYWDYNLDHACTEYGGCIFRKVCLSQNPEPWLATDFERRRWDPVTRTETKVIEVAS
jgi:hypothetical protein